MQHEFRIGGDVKWNVEPTADKIGGKAMSLYTMHAMGLNVPPAIVLPCIDTFFYQNNPTEYQVTARKVVEQGLAWVEKTMGRKCLFSVRSGGPVSMPGMMDTVLNVGLNNENRQTFSTMLSKTTVADCAKRLVEMFNGTVCKISLLDLMSMSVVDQVMLAVEAVFKSWNSERAVAYRKLNNISDDLGTAVTIQAMVYGNLNDKSGSGVMFTRDPSTGENTAIGEFLFNAQGEDVVNGSRTPESFQSVAVTVPAWYKKLVYDVSPRLEKHYRDMVDVEFTVESGTLYILQSRRGKRTPRAALRIATDLLRAGTITPADLPKYVKRSDVYASVAKVILDKGSAKFMGTGISAGGGIAAGRVCTTIETAIQTAKKEPVILVRHETIPEDILGMNAAVGILTETGGTTSHAAVVSRAMGKACVTGCEVAVKVSAGDWIVINGDTGEVWVDTKQSMVISAGDDTLVEQLAAAMTKQSDMCLLSNRRNLGVPVMVRAADAAFDMEETLAAIRCQGAKVTVDMQSAENFWDKDDQEVWDLLAPYTVNPAMIKFQAEAKKIKDGGVSVLVEAKTVAEAFSGSPVILPDDFINKVVGGAEMYAKLCAALGEPLVAKSVVRPYTLVLGYAG